MTDSLTPELEVMLARAARLRSNGSSWPQTALQLQTDPKNLEQLSYFHYKHYERCLRDADLRMLLEARQEGVLRLRQHLRSDDAKIAQRAGDIIGRIEVAHAKLHAKPKRAKTKSKKKKKKKKKAADFRFPKLDIEVEVPPGWDSDYRNWFPETPVGKNARCVFEYLSFADPAQIAADREIDFREQCYARQIELPESGPLPYWMRPDYDPSGGEAVGWMPGDANRFAYDILGTRKEEERFHLTDIYRKSKVIVHEWLNRDDEDDEGEDGRGNAVPRVPTSPLCPASGGEGRGEGVFERERPSPQPSPRTAGEREQASSSLAPALGGEGRGEGVFERQRPSPQPSPRKAGAREQASSSLAPALGGEGRGEGVFERERPSPQPSPRKAG